MYCVKWPVLQQMITAKKGTIIKNNDGNDNVDDGE